MKARTSHCTIGLALLTASTLASSVGTHAGGHGTAAIGEPGVPGAVTRTVIVDMTDAMRFIPSSVNVKQNETIRFAVKNSGKLKHEMVLGSAKELKEHYELMKKHPEMEHADPNMITLAPGATGEIVWRFTRSGTVHFGCLQPGHYDAGMKGKVNVVRAGSARAPDHKH